MRFVAYLCSHKDSKEIDFPNYFFEFCKILKNTYMTLPYTYKRNLLLFFAIFAFGATLNAQKRNQLYLQYIETYKDIAVDEMKKYKIPASITLAQGILESGAGRSQLARKSNNHFGIKCGSSWKGKTVRHHDDARNECFRAYKNARDSYEDHSKFLATGARYKFLFNLDITDYKGWARGLKKAGYATDPSYANRLITIIEDYDLYKYDRSGKRSSSSSAKKEVVVVNPHQVYIANKIAYVIARRGDTFESIGKEFGIKAKNLIKYNDLHEGYTLTTGDIIYLKKKNKKADKKYRVHVVKDGDSMHSISQIYGIRLKNLYKMNRLDGDYIPEIGATLKLR